MTATMPPPSPLHLPQQHFFPLWQVAQIARCSLQHVINQVESGEIAGCVDLRGKDSTKAMIRIPRAAVVEFLERRKITVPENGNGKNGGRH